MYYPKHQIKILNRGEYPNLKDTEGNPVDLQSVIKTSVGRFYRNDTTARNTGNFLGIPEFIREETERKQEKEEPLQESQIDYTKGSVKRFFVKNRATGKIKELSKEDYRELLEDKPRYINTVEVDWTIQGPVDDLEIRGRQLKGAETKNREAITQASREVPGLEQKITDYTRFVKDIPVNDEYKIKNRRGPDQFYVPAPSKL